MSSSPILQGKHAVIFGAGGSIGAAAARQFAAEGRAHPADQLDRQCGRGLAAAL